jgi:hypothetical protein
MEQPPGFVAQGEYQDLHLHGEPWKWKSNVKMELGSMLPYYLVKRLFAANGYILLTLMDPLKD